MEFDVIDGPSGPEVEGAAAMVGSCPVMAG